MVAAFDYCLHGTRRRGAVDRHRDARAGRRRPRRPPAPRLRDRAGDRGRRRGADPRVLRRPRGVGAVAPARLPARPRHRGDQAEQPAGDRRDPRRARHHRLGRHLATSARQRSLRDHPDRRAVHRRARRAEPVRAVVAGLRAAARRPSAARGPRRSLPVRPRPRLHGPAAGRPLHRLRRRARLPGARAEHPRLAALGHVLPRPLPADEGRGRSSSTCRRRAPLEDVDRPAEGAARGVPRGVPRLLRAARRRPTARRCAGPTRRSCWSRASACSASARTSRPPGSPASSTSTRST